MRIYRVNDQSFNLNYIVCLEVTYLTGDDAKVELKIKLLPEVRLPSASHDDKFRSACPGDRSSIPKRCPDNKKQTFQLIDHKQLFNKMSLLTFRKML
jgi:hypothetical protein